MPTTLTQSLIHFEIATLAPVAANRSTVAGPRPGIPPVTRAVRFLLKGTDKVEDNSMLLLACVTYTRSRTVDSKVWDLGTDP